MLSAEARELPPLPRQLERFDIDIDADRAPARARHTRHRDRNLPLAAAHIQADPAGPETNSREKSMRRTGHHMRLPRQTLRVGQTANHRVSGRHLGKPMIARRTFEHSGQRDVTQFLYYDQVRQTWKKFQAIGEGSKDWSKRSGRLSSARRSM
jgi:hypothetical protein